MLRLRETDLVNALETLAAHRPNLNRYGLALSLHAVKLGDARNYLFLARAEKTWVFPLSEVYQEGSYANRCWLSPVGMSQGRPDALLLQPKFAPKTRPRGTLTVLNYSDMALDVEIFSLLTCPTHREQHLKALLRSCHRQAEYGKWADYLNYLSREGGGTNGHGR